MKYFWKINIYEVQVILYWILGNILLDSGKDFWGWVAIIYGWITFIYCIVFSVKHYKKLKDLF